MCLFGNPGRKIRKWASHMIEGYVLGTVQTPRKDK